MRETANFAIALLFGLLIAVAPNGRSAVAQGQDIKGDITHFFGHPIFFDLFSPPPAEIEERQLREAAADYSRAQAAWSRGPSASGDAEINFSTARGNLEHLAKDARSLKVRKRARMYLSRLPKHFVRGHRRIKKVSSKKQVGRHRVKQQPALTYRRIHRVRPLPRKHIYPNNDDVSASGGGE